MTDAEIIAPCGLSCHRCILHQALEDEDLRWFLKQQSRHLYSCKGCLETGGRPLPFGLQRPCNIYSCVMEREIRNCQECQNYPCKKVIPTPEGMDLGELGPSGIKFICIAKAMGYGIFTREEVKEIALGADDDPEERLKHGIVEMEHDYPKGGSCKPFDIRSREKYFYFSYSRGFTWLFGDYQGVYTSKQKRRAFRKAFENVWNVLLNERLLVVQDGKIVWESEEDKDTTVLEEYLEDGWKPGSYRIYVSQKIGETVADYTIFRPEEGNLSKPKNPGNYIWNSLEEARDHALSLSREFHQRAPGRVYELKYLVCRVLAEEEFQW